MISPSVWLPDDVSWSPVRSPAMTNSLSITITTYTICDTHYLYSAAYPLHTIRSQPPTLPRPHNTIQSLVSLLVLFMPYSCPSLILIIHLVVTSLFLVTPSSTYSMLYDLRTFLLHQVSGLLDLSWAYFLPLPYSIHPYDVISILFSNVLTVSISIRSHVHSGFC